MSKAKKEEPRFEQDIEQLDSIVAALEEGGLSLDESLKQFEEGVRLARRCQQALTEAEKKIELLTRNAQGDLETKPFCDEGEEGTPSAQARTSPAKDTAPWDDDDDGEPEPPEEDEDAELLF
jgi:exodeoxyribonuclease VII small subunit